MARPEAAALAGRVWAGAGASAVAVAGGVVVDDFDRLADVPAFDPGRADERIDVVDDWRGRVWQEILPWAAGDDELGEDLLEIGPGYGAATDVLEEQ